MLHQRETQSPLRKRLVGRLGMLSVLVLAALLLALVSPAVAGPPTDDEAALRRLPVDHTAHDPAPPAKRAISPDAPLNVLIAGDSFASPLASTLASYAKRDGMMPPRLDYRLSSGLALPNFF